MAGTDDALGGRPRPAAHGPVSVLVAVALAVLVAGAVVLAAVHLVPSAVSLAPDATPEAADVGGAAPDPVARATVVATASCATPGARDTVTLDVGGTRELPVESCGNRVGTVLDVEVPSSGAVRVRGTGAASPAAAGGSGETSGPATRVAVLLTVVAALGTGGLFLAVARDRHRRPGRTGHSGRPAAPRRAAGSPRRR